MAKIDMGKNGCYCTIRIDEAQKNADYARPFTREKTFPYVCSLNRFHGSDHSQRYWRIIFGNWFGLVIMSCSTAYSHCANA